MSLTKNRLIDSIAGPGITRKEASQVVEAMLEAIKSTMISDEDVMISGFGKFSIQDKKQSRGRNPATGNDLMLDARRIVVFSCSNVLKNRLNGNKPHK